MKRLHMGLAGIASALALAVASGTVWAQASSALRSGDRLTLTLAVTFDAAFAGRTVAGFAQGSRPAAGDALGVPHTASRGTQGSPWWWRRRCSCWNRISSRTKSTLYSFTWWWWNWWTFKCKWHKWIKYYIICW